jgi:hypothetical protein
MAALVAGETPAVPTARLRGMSIQSLLFLKKKKQKDFYFSARTQFRPGNADSRAGTRNKSLFASFSSEKEESLTYYDPLRTNRT